MNRIIPGAVVLIAIVAAGFLAIRNTSKKSTNKPDAGQATTTFSTPKKSPHFETSSPAHGQVLAAAPINIVIDFNFDLHAKSTIKVTNNGKEYTTGSTTIDTNKLTLRRAFDTSAPDGTYRATYSACWPDGSCHDGHHEFAIDRSRAASFEDMTGKKELTIRMSQIKFQPMEIKISKGTKVTWVNDEAVEHYVNTDSHPGHTYFLDQNSRGLSKGQSFSNLFELAGLYPYHCSPHVPQKMRGTILVI
ncbi:MAG: plastocyanin/azurin family copper-binding protein [Patescibacteria group bacterium]